jgi:hypothetical protein
LFEACLVSISPAAPRSSLIFFTYPPDAGSRAQENLLAARHLVIGNRETLRVSERPFNDRPFFPTAFYLDKDFIQFQNK